MLAGALSGEAVLKGRSALASLVGQSIASEAVTLVDDGRLIEGTAAAPFDDEGVRTSRTPLVEDGVLRGFLHNTFTAARLGTASTGNAGRQGYRSVPGVSPTNLYVQRGSASPGELLRAAGRGVYVQDVTGLHSGASSVTGDFSVGAAGLAIEDGALGRTAARDDRGEHPARRPAGRDRTRQRPAPSRSAGASARPPSWSAR